jgi:hypothetical protein
MPAPKLARLAPAREGRRCCSTRARWSEFESSWTAGVPVHVHGLVVDPFFVDEGDVGAAQALVESTEDAELFL